MQDNEIGYNLHSKLNSAGIDFLV